MRFLYPAIAVVVLIVVGGVACGGGGNSPSTTGSAPAAANSASPTNTPTPDPKAQAYFTQLEAIFKKASDDSASTNATLNTALNDAGNDIEKEKAAMDGFLTTTEGIFNTAIGAMNALDVPQGARTDHDSFVASAKASVLLASRLQDDMKDVKSDDEIRSLIDQFDQNYQPLLDSADTACKDLQSIATANGVQIDLVCQGV